MTPSKLRRQIAWEAARMMHSREVGEYYVAKQKASKRLCKGWIKPSDLPTNSEIREQVQSMSRLLDGAAGHSERLLKMRTRAVWWMEKLAGFHPKIIGSVLSGSVREGSDVDLHVFAANPHSITLMLDDMNVHYEIERKRIVKDDQQRVFTHIHVKDEFPIELTVYHPSQLGFRFKSSITNKPIETASLATLKKIIAMEHEIDERSLARSVDELETAPDRFVVFQALLIPLENVVQNVKYHPEGDALFHSLQVFEIARDQMAYDEEFLLAALLHDVGKAIDPDDHVAAGLEAIEGFVSPRTAWLIAHHMEAHKVYDRSIGARRRRRLSESPWFDDLMALETADRLGRVPGAETVELEEALDYIENIESLFG